jgi:hypothetical protein
MKQPSSRRFKIRLPPALPAGPRAPQRERLDAMEIGDDNR